MNVLIDADTIRSPELRHEIPVSVVDPFLLLLVTEEGAERLSTLPTAL